nr:zinc finger BED domain-containing protein RICESLEEPER 2-like [Tanacetum cinerariifolium]
MNFLLHVALVLDPRNKLYYLKYCLGLIYGKHEESEEEMFESDDEDLSKKWQVAKHAKHVKSTLTELYKHYKMKSNKEKDQNIPVSSSSTPHTRVASRLKVDIESGFGKYMEKREGIKNIEVDIYLCDGTNRRDEKFDVLDWWKQNSEKFPILSQVARHVLAMPISTVASELEFSTGSVVIDKFRSSLTLKTAKALICTQDWLRSLPAHVEDMQVNGQQLEDLVKNLAKIKLGFPAQIVRSSNAIALDLPYLLVLITETSQSRQHESRKSPTAELFDVNSGRISIVFVNTKEYHSDVLAIITRIMSRTC